MRYQTIVFIVTITLLAIYEFTLAKVTVVTFVTQMRLMVHQKKLKSWAHINNPSQVQDPHYISQRFI